MATQPQPAFATQTQAAVPEYVTLARQADEAVLSRVEKNPIYQFIFVGDATKEQRITQIVDYLLAGLADNKARPEDLDRRRQELAELNASIQVIRRQLGAEQAHEITSRAYANFQQILGETTGDVEGFQGELAPLVYLAELFAKFGANGNLIERINIAKEQQRQRTGLLTDWWHNHDLEVAALRGEVATYKDEIKADKLKLEAAWIGKGALQARILNNEAALREREQQLAAANARTPPELQAGGEIEPVDESILELQNIGGEKFKDAVAKLRDNTEEALAKISTNFDAAIVGLTNTRESFIVMDRNCGDATFALSVLEFAVQEAERRSREIAQDLIAKNEEAAEGPMAALDRMEREQRSEQILGFTTALTTFLTDVGVAVTSLRKGKTVIQDILRMNQMALDQANTHKITGIANTADAVTITIGSIIEVCNRAASQALSDGLNRMRDLAEKGSARLVGGTVESLKQQNEQLAGFVASVDHLKTMTHEISANTVDLLKQQFELVGQMREASGSLAEATTEAQRTSFAARAGVSVEKKKDETPPPADRPGFRLRMGHS